MTAINRLTENLKINPKDSFPFWDASNGRTRRVTGETLISYITEKNIAEDGASFDSDGNLIITLNDGSTINAGKLPKSVLTVDGVKTDDIETGKLLRSHQNPQPMNEEGSEVVVIDIDTTYEPWKIETTAAILLDVVSIDSIDKCGIEYRIDFKESEVANVSFHLHPIHSEGAHIKIVPINMAAKSKPIYVFGNFPSGKSFSYNVTHSTVFSEYDGEWRTEESSQLLSVTSGVMREDGNEKKPIHGIAIKPDSNLTQEITEDGVLVLGSAPSDGGVDGDYLPLAGGELSGPLEIKPTDAGYSLTVYKLDGTVLFTVLTGESSNSLDYRKTLSDYEESSHVFDLINRLYADTHYVKQGGGFIAGDVVLFRSNFYMTGSEVMSDADFFYWKTGTEFGCGNVSRNEDGSWQGDVVDFAIMREDHIEFAKLAVKDFVVLDDDGNIMIHSNPTAKATSFNNFVEFKQTITYKGSTENDNNPITRKALNEALQEGFPYSGQGEGIPYRQLVSTGNFPQTEVIGHFANNSSSGEDFFINLDESLVGSITYIDGGNAASRKFVVRDNKTSRTSSRTVRPGERWACHAYLPGDFNGTNFEWHRLDLGASAEFIPQDWLGSHRYAVVVDNVTCRKPNNHFDISTDGGNAIRISFDESLEYGELRLKATTGRNEYRFVTVVAMNGKQKDIKVYKDYNYHVKVSSVEGVDIEFIKTSNSLVATTFDSIDVSGFDAEEPKIKPLMKRFTSTDLISIPLSLPDGFSVMVRQVMVKRSSGVELEMGFTYKYDGENLKVHLNEVGTGVLLAGIIKDEI